MYILQLYLNFLSIFVLNKKNLNIFFHSYGVEIL